MEVRKNGSVFRIELGSPVGFETRISFAVNTHGDMKRPRIEVSADALVQLFMEMLPYIMGEAILGNDSWAFVTKQASVKELVRIVDELAVQYRTEYVRAIPMNAELQIEVLGALQQRDHKSAPNWQALIAAVNILLERLAHKPQELRIGYKASPGGILNAYREGNLTFDEAVTALGGWKARR